MVNKIGFIFSKKKKNEQHIQIEHKMWAVCELGKTTKSLNEITKRKFLNTENIYPDDNGRVEEHTFYKASKMVFMLMHFHVVLYKYVCSYIHFRSSEQCMR